MECFIETKASTILQFIHGLRGDLQVTFEEGTWAGWLYDLLKPHVTELVVCNPRKIALLKDGSKSDRIDAHKLADLLYMNKIRPVYHGEHGLRMLKELSRGYLTISKDLGRVINRIKALYRSWAIPCAGTQVYAPRYRSITSARSNGWAECRDKNVSAPSRRRRMSLDIPSPETSSRLCQCDLEA